MKKYLNWGTAWVLAMAIIFGLVIYDSLQPYEPKDDSDGPHENSHMDVFTDHLTGCQYLYRNSLTPRMGADGKQICRKD
jgi:hypothetical protein